MCKIVEDTMYEVSYLFLGPNNTSGCRFKLECPKTELANEPRVIGVTIRSEITHSWIESSSNPYVFNGSVPTACLRDLEITL